MRDVVNRLPWRRATRRLFRAVHAGDPDTAIAVLKSGKFPVNRKVMAVRRRFGLAEHGDPQCVRGRVQMNGSSLLHVASLVGSVQVVQALVDRQADINVLDAVCSDVPVNESALPDY